MNWKILHVKETDWSNRVGSEIDSEVKIFDIFGLPVHLAILQRASFIFPSPNKTFRTPWSNFEIFLT